jgi:hypothetical protein
VAEGIPADNPHFVLLFFIAQLFLRELAKCYRLVQVIPMDMTGYYGKATSCNTDTAQTPAKACLRLRYITKRQHQPSQYHLLILMVT